MKVSTSDSQQCCVFVLESCLKYVKKARVTWFFFSTKADKKMLNDKLLWVTEAISKYQYVAETSLDGTSWLQKTTVIVLLIGFKCLKYQVTSMKRNQQVDIVDNENIIRQI